MTRAGAIAAVLCAFIGASVGASSTVRANIWHQATGDDNSAAATQREIYELALSLGDDAAKEAHADGSSLVTMKRQLAAALDSYRNAAAARPDAAEPYFRIGWMLYTFYFQNCDYYSHLPHTLVCDPDPNTYNRVVAQQIIDAWNAAEHRAPLDPRFAARVPEDESNLVFERAILNTKFGDNKHLAEAARDYRELLGHLTGPDRDSEALVVANLAETEMMLGHLDDAIDLYREVLRHGGDVSTSYGLAVALDRNERGAEARTIVEDLGTTSFDEFFKNLHDGHTFYVPSGEKYYYLALAEESLGAFDNAILSWNEFIRSGAHPQFQARAAANRDALIAKRHARPIAPPIPIDLGL